MISLRYAEFNCVQDGKIAKTGLFVDIIGFMIQAGVNPLPPQTGSYFVYPGQLTIMDYFLKMQMKLKE